MKKKNVFNYATMLFCMLMGLAVTASCSKGDSEEGVDGGSGNTDSYSQYVGKWSGSATSSTGGTWGLIMQLYANKTADFKLLLIGGEVYGPLKTRQARKWCMMKTARPSISIRKMTCTMSCGSFPSLATTWCWTSSTVPSTWNAHRGQEAVLEEARKQASAAPSVGAPAVAVT